MSSENTPRCRLCGYSLKASNGCDVCATVKSVLVWPVVEDAANELSAQEVISSTLRTMKTRLRKLNRAMQHEEGYDSHLTRDLASIARTLKELAAEQRKLEDREDEHYAKLGIEGRMQLYADQFFARLPQDFQIRLLELMKATYEAQNASLLPEGPEELAALTAHSDEPYDE